MGAEIFLTEASGKNPLDAFSNAVNQAQWDHGNSGYTGTIAEKGSYVMIHCPAGEDPYKYAQILLDEYDERICDKWGPAGCIKLNNGNYLFFGWASA